MRRFATCKLCRQNLTHPQQGEFCFAHEAAAHLRTHHSFWHDFEKNIDALKGLKEDTWARFFEL